MEAKDTVVHFGDCAWHSYMTGGSLGTEKRHYKCTCGREAQAEISFKLGATQAIAKTIKPANELYKKAKQEGRKEEHKIMIGVAVDEGNKAHVAGRKEVVKWIETCKTNPLSSDDYGYYIWKAALQAKLKSWGIKEE